MQHIYDPPTPEQWQALPAWLRWYIFAQVLVATWKTALAVNQENVGKEKP